MNIKSKRINILFWFLALLPFLMSAAFYSHLPVQVAVHFDAAGTPDGYAPRAVAAFGLPAFYFAITLFVFVMFKIDPKSSNIERSPQLKAVILWGTVLLFDLVHAVVLMRTVNTRLDMITVISIAVGILYVAIGNYLPKCQPNYTMGIKLPWTLASEENWRRTHRFAGPLWIIGGILIILSSFKTFVATIVMVVSVILLCAIPAVYSYLLFRREKRNKP